MGAVDPGDLFGDLGQPPVAVGELLTRPRDRLLALAEVLAQGCHRIVLDVLDQHDPLGQLLIALGELRTQAGHRCLALGTLRQLAVQPRELVDVLGQPPVAVGKVLTQDRPSPRARRVRPARADRRRSLRARSDVPQARSRRLASSASSSATRPESESVFALGGLLLGEQSISVVEVLAQGGHVASCSATIASRSATTA